MPKRFAAVVAWLNAALASPYPLPLALGGVAGYLVLGPRLGWPDQRIDLAFLLTLVTFTLVFVIEHQGYRERAALQLKLDELLRAVSGADNAKIGVEELHAGEIDDMREKNREEGRRQRVG
ncbi:MAG TPA: low affinity iron permease family protein [Candidatus Limnocylindria bacterium]|nr:low affinity iron permease family protein [Candidatus Limnocylindria bacterium]